MSLLLAAWEFTVKGDRWRIDPARSKQAPGEGQVFGEKAFLNFTWLKCDQMMSMAMSGSSPLRALWAAHQTTAICFGS